MSGMRLGGLGQSPDEVAQKSSGVPALLADGGTRLKIKNSKLRSVVTELLLVVLLLTNLEVNTISDNKNFIKQVILYKTLKSQIDLENCMAAR